MPTWNIQTAFAVSDLGICSHLGLEVLARIFLTRRPTTDQLDPLVVAETGQSLMRQLCKPGFYDPGPSNLMRRSPAPIVSLKEVVKVDRSWRPTVRTGGRIKKGQDHYRIWVRSLGKDLDLSYLSRTALHAMQPSTNISSAKGPRRRQKGLFYP